MTESDKILKLENLLKRYIKDLKGEFVSKNSRYDGDICNIIQEFTKQLQDTGIVSGKAKIYILNLKKGRVFG